MGNWNIDEADWPLVVITMDGQFEDSEMDGFFEAMVALFRRGQSFSAVIDASRFQNPSVRHRMQMRSFMVENREYTKQNCVGVAYVIVSPVIRMFLRAVFLLQKPSAETRITESMVEAREWAQARTQHI